VLLLSLAYGVLDRPGRKDDDRERRGVLSEVRDTTSSLGPSDERGMVPARKRDNEVTTFEMRRGERKLGLEEAKALAEIAHGPQRYGDGLYSIHLAAVEQVMRRFGVTDNDLLVAAWLHDTLEDTNLRAEEIARLFGVRVRNLVQAVTDEPGKNRRERHEKTYPKLLQAGNAAVLLKLADRIANVEQSAKETDPVKLKSYMKMYRNEYPDFQRMLRRDDQGETAAVMWRRLDELLSVN
jgi:(p)ppGpp synthase/HD superfamily hydrolase